jgi:HEAT repeat protein
VRLTLLYIKLLRTGCLGDRQEEIEVTPKKIEERAKVESIETLINNLGNADDDVRVKARRSLVAMGKTAVAPLAKGLENKKYLIRWEAAKALNEIGNPAAAPALVKALEDEEFDVRWIAAEGLIKMNINGVIPLLRALKERGDSTLLREGAHHVFHDLSKGALKKILAPVLAVLEGIEPGEEVPLAALKAMETLEKLKKI